MKSDKQLKQDVMEELDWNPAIDANSIGVEVKDGIVTLTGHLNSFLEKWNVEQAVQKISGVKGLAIEMDIKLPGSNQRNDADIAHSVRNILEWHTSIPNERIRIMVESGWVTLSGEVDWLYQKKAVEESIRFVTGVKGIKNHLTIKSSSIPKNIKIQIEAALQRRAHREVEHISVEIEGDTVTLNGTIPSYPERCAVLEAVRSARGVAHVKDHMMTAP